MVGLERMKPHPVGAYGALLGPCDAPGRLHEEPFGAQGLQGAQASGGRQSIFLLDEVDAALDEQNQQMVAQLLQVR